jgi:acetylornithine deacetylase
MAYLQGEECMNAAAAAGLIGPSTATLDIIRTLIAFNTVSRESNLGLIEWARDYLARLGVRPRLTYDAAGKKANLFATLGEGRKPGIVLSGHTDVVPVGDQAWDTDPFVATVRDGRLYGRGSADMKSFIGVALAYAPKFLAAPGGSAMHLAFSYDEEVGCFGVRGLIADLQEIGLTPAGCIVGEPTLMQPVVGHKGTHRFKCCVRGREAHSALTTHGVNSIEYAARLVVYIRQMAERYAELETRDYGFPVPYTTLQTSTIAGGTAQNIVPRDCEFQVDVRTLPGRSFDEIYTDIQDYASQLVPLMRRTAPEADIRFEFQASIDDFQAAEEEDIVQLAARLAGSAARSKVSFGTEAGIFRNAGIPTVVIGPGDIAQAHRPNEFITLEQIALAERFMDRLVAAESPA